MHPDWQLLIRNALVFDSTGAPPRHEDVAMAGGRIAARGPSLDPSRAERVIDAPGQWLMPGLLDIHIHLDLEVELAPGLPESVRHGTTTLFAALSMLDGRVIARTETGHTHVEWLRFLRQIEPPRTRGARRDTA